MQHVPGFQIVTRKQSWSISQSYSFLIVFIIRLQLVVRWPLSAPGYILPDSNSAEKRSFSSPNYGKQCFDLAVIGTDWVMCLSLNQSLKPGGCNCTDWLILDHMVNLCCMVPFEITWTQSEKDKLFPQGNLGCWFHEEHKEIIRCNRNRYPAHN